jgi:hypothetical protein
VYEFAYHRAKLAFLRDGTLDHKRATRATSTARFSALADFLESIPQTCPHDLFQKQDGSRGSQIAPDFLALDKLIVVKKQNAATETAALIVPAVGSNYERHPKLQRFMLANDSTTVAVEVPVWLARDDIAALEREHGIRLLSAGAERSITGHIDFIQVRNGAVHILDYKPDARTNKPIAQLTITRSRFPASRALNSLTSNAPGSTGTITASFFPARFFRADDINARHNLPLLRCATRRAGPRHASTCRDKPRQIAASAWERGRTTPNSAPASLSARTAFFIVAVASTHQGRQRKICRLS